MGRVVAHPEYVSNDGRHAAGSPKLPTETERFRSPGQQGHELRVVGGRQARARARGGSTAERLAATLSGAAQPAFVAPFANLSLTRELHLDLDPAVEAPFALAPLIDPNVHSCGSVPPHRKGELRHPAPDF